MRVRPSSGATSYRFFVPVAEYHSDRRRTSSPKTTPARSMYFCVVLKSECPAIRMIASGDIPARRVRVSRPAVSFLETATARIVSTSTGAYACRVSADTGEAKLPPTTTPTARAARRPQPPPIPQADPPEPAPGRAGPAERVLHRYIATPAPRPDRRRIAQGRVHPGSALKVVS
jgi:hypothetical protein